MDRIDSYEKARAVCKTARNKVIGKPLNSTGYRLKQDGEDYVIWRGDDYFYTGDICRIHPDNTLTFVLTPEKLYQNNVSLSQMVGKLTPLDLYRKRTGIYRVGKSYSALWVGAKKEFGMEPMWPDSKYYDWYKDVRQCVDSEIKDMPEYFQGMRFDLNTLKCLNPKPNLTDPNNIDAEARKQWIADCRTFRRNIKTWNRMGALAGTIGEIFQYYKEHDEFPDGTSTTHRGSPDPDDRWFVGVLKENTINRDVVMHLMRRYRFYPSWAMRIGPDLVAERMVENALLDLKRNSLQLRKAYGVFKSV